jgi:hypothetical protein
MMTKLQAVNDILTSVGETPALTLITGAADTVAAETILDSETKKVLSKGYHFNTDIKFPLQPDVNGRIAVPLDALFIDVEEQYRGQVDLVPRNNFMYDRKAQTDILGQSYFFTIHRLLSFESIPYETQRLIVAQAAKRYQGSYVGSPALANEIDMELMDAVSTHEDLDADLADANVLTNPDVFGPLWRQRYRTF